MATILPIYYQIKQTIRNWIINREYNPGEKIPSENELAERFNVSRLTVRQAISQLSQEGFLTARRGDGTFITENVDLIDSYSFEFRGLIDDFFFAQIAPLKTRFVEIQKETITKLIREKLQLGNDVTEVVRIKRIRYLKDRLFTYTVNYLPLEIGMKIKEKALFGRSLLQVMEQDLGIRFTGAVQTIEAHFADHEVSKQLAIPSGSPILFVERIMYTKKQKPVEIFQSSYRGDMYKFIVRYKNVLRKGENRWSVTPEIDFHSGK
jgi:GntR family transcriptional regulator